MTTRLNHTGKTTLHSWIVLSFAVTALAMCAQAQTTITTFSIADSQIFGGSAWQNTNRGGQAQMYVGDPGVGESRPLVRFSLASIPAGQTISSATLKLYLNAAPPNQHNVDGYRLLVDWTEGDGNGISPVNGTYGVTWQYRDFTNTLSNWTVPGAGGAGSDHAATASFTLTPADQGFDGNTFVTKDVTSDVQAWYTGGASNFGWLLQSSAFSSGVYTGYCTREEPGTSIDPQLIITYIPEPSSALLLLGGFALLRRRRSES